MATDNRTTADILLDALTYGKTEVVVSDVNSDSNAAHNLIVRLKSHKITNGSWRYYQRSTPERKTVVIVMSPRCQDPAPPMRQATTAAKEKKKQSEAEPEQNGLAEWVLKNICNPAMLHISVVPAEDIKRLHGVSNYETYMTEKARQRMNRQDIRVMVREVTKDQTSKRKAYNARIIFGKGNM